MIKLVKIKQGHQKAEKNQYNVYKRILPAVAMVIFLELQFNVPYKAKSKKKSYYKTLFFWLIFFA